MRQLMLAARLVAVFTLLCGVAYPLAITGIAQLVMPGAANGSLVSAGGRVVGSALIGQSFAAPRYFWGRPSAAGTGYDAAASSGSNLGPSSTTRATETRARAIASSEAHGGRTIPVDLVSASASGLDPHISPAAAFAQVSRVARARGRAEDQIWAMVTNAVEPRQWGVLGEPRVNVLALNMSLDTLPPAAAAGTPQR